MRCDCEGLEIRGFRDLRLWELRPRVSGLILGSSHRLHSSSFLALPHRILQELLWSL